MYLERKRLAEIHANTAKLCSANFQQSFYGSNKWLWLLWKSLLKKFLYKQYSLNQKSSLQMNYDF